MNNTICTILIVLLGLIINAPSHASSDRHAMHKKSLAYDTLFTTSINLKSPTRLSARDDQTVDCLRSGNCRK
ncbi:hypothetical protein [Iningainema tapete]|uniref:Secreted protein n=1 Tax=Iningainema tapete BLCC-T55 TaxID=2748662 RepID=A0A8J6XPI4_9CYAN|nr:hypothetical protein [Iningainema tapete]MBD2771103.1 hypothetical protein [Iningainema tapete BLCC-T55]